MQDEQERKNSSVPTAFLDAFIFDPEVEPPADQPIFSGFLSLGDLVVWIGREKHRKSNVILQCAICAALGRDFLNFRFAASVPQKVVLVDYESKNTKSAFWLRHNMICRTMNLTEDERKILRVNLRVVLVRDYYKAGKFFPRFSAKTKSEKKTKGSEEFWTNFRNSYPADIYVFDPMRCLHAGNENDSSIIESLLTKLRQFFPNSAIIIPHHMTKPDYDSTVSLTKDMRAWSDGARGSSAIKAHADVIVCQERKTEKDSEVVYIGAFMKDGPDVTPIPLEETDSESFFWKVSPNVPEDLRAAYKALRKADRPFRDKKDAAEIIAQGTGKSVQTGYRRVGDLLNRGLLTKEGSQVVLKEASDAPP